MRKFGLIGKSLLHSSSKVSFLLKFTREHLSDCTYENYPLDDLKNLRPLILNEPGLSGLNVTIPYKIEIIPHLDVLSPEAKAIGAVNCIKINRNGNKIFLEGYNTDADAFRETLNPFLSKDHIRALVLGTGGAARAVCHALTDLNIDFTLVTRDSKPGLLTYPGITRKIMEDHLLIVNTTPVGMFPDDNQCPLLPYKYLKSNHLLYDLIYNPEETLFLKKGIGAGAQVKNGSEMLHLQAEMSWKTWNIITLHPSSPPQS
jgi:shikimate dehydrogenase